MLSEEHKARLAEGRKKRANNLRTEGALRAALFCEWSQNYAAGRATLRDCPFDPENASDNDFEYARAEGLI
jgi:hypothetical protein